MSAIIGRKIGMTQIYAEDGQVVPITVLEAGPCPVIGQRTMKKNGYEATQIAYGAIRPKRVSKPRAGQFTSPGVEPRRLIREVPTIAGVEVGQDVKVDQFEVGNLVDITGTSKGKGFAGVVRRHHFSGGKASHGVKTKKQPGSIGAASYPARVIKGKKLPGQMGNKRVTTKNLTVMGIDAEENLIWVKGAVPGSTNGFVIIRKAAAPLKKGGK